MTDSPGIASIADSVDTESEVTVNADQQDEVSLIVLPSPTLSPVQDESINAINSEPSLESEPMTRNETQPQPTRRKLRRKNKAENVSDVPFQVPKSSQLEGDDSNNDDDAFVPKSSPRRTRGRPRGNAHQNQEASRKAKYSSKRIRDEEVEESNPAKRTKKQDPPRDDGLQGALDMLVESNAAQAQALSQIQSEVRELRKQHKAKCQELKKAGAETLQLTERVTTSEDALARQAKTLIDLEAEYMALEDQKADLEHQLVEELIARNASLEPYDKIADGYIVEVWKVMSYNIFNFVRTCLTEQPISEDNTPRASPDLHCYLEMSRNPSTPSHIRKILLEGYIWKIINWKIFSGGEDVWAGQFGSKLTQFIMLVQEGSHDAPEYLGLISRMKTKVVRDMNKIKTDEVDMNGMKSLISYIAAGLLPFTTNRDLDMFYSYISEILGQAVELHSIFMKSKAIFITSGIELGVAFDPASMDNYYYGDYESETFDSTSIVHMVSSALTKIGNADGEYFERRSVLCKAKVLIVEKTTDNQRLVSGIGCE